jgi:hypothetical protein
VKLDKVLNMLSTPIEDIVPPPSIPVHAIRLHKVFKPYTQYLQATAQLDNVEASKELRQQKDMEDVQKGYGGYGKCSCGKVN